MSTQDFNQEFPLKTRRSKRIVVNLSIALIAMAVHAFLQTMLGSFVAGLPITDLPQTTLTTLVLLIFVFLTTSIGLVVQSSGIAFHLREKSLVSLLSAFLVSVVLVLTFRMPYSSVFLFWGFILQIIVCVPTLLLLEKFNKPVIGIPETSLADFADLIAPRFVRPIMPSMDRVTELDLIILKESELASDEWSDFLVNCIKSSIDVEEHTNLKERLSGKVDLKKLSFRKSKQTIGTNAYLPLKRVIDIILSACLLILLLPFMSLVALSIFIESSGGPVYQQRRVGFKSRPFTIYKFRTMRTAVVSDEAKFAEQDDVRITRIGKVLRNNRIDELPQLWNVLIGEMSLIGPRPEQLKLIGSIQNEIPAFSLRHSLRPGITGWAQVCQGYADDISATRTKLSYDLWYVNNVSLLVDISIAIRTVRVVLTGFGSR